MGNIYSKPPPFLILSSGNRRTATAEGVKHHVSRVAASADNALHNEIEVLHALRRHNLLGNVSSERARLALGRLRDTQLVRYPHTPLMERIWDLKNSLTAYDAAYVALAEALGAPLVTLDARLARVPGVRAAIEVYG